MKFLELTLPEDLSRIEGALLAHSVRSDGLNFKKGRRLTAEDAERLAASGAARLWVVRLDPDDVHEDEAARTLGAALAGPGLRAEAPFTGRVNLYADNSGLMRANADLICALNAVDEAVTLATLPDWSRVAAGQMVATLKIIPFAVGRDRLEACRAIVQNAQRPALQLHPFTTKTAVFIATRLSDRDDKLIAKAEQVTQDRLALRGGTLARSVRCTHEVEALGEALRGALRDAPDMVLILGASAITDRGDIIPRAIEAAGGAVLRFGMPVDPGNLLLLGQVNEIPVVGLPGCARSPALNGVDWVLDRLCADIAVSQADFVPMGVGGLLKEMAARPQPRDRRKTAPTKQARGTKSVAGLILAAGQSRRMGNDNKLLEEISGKPMIRFVAETVAEADISDLVIVTGHEGGRIATALAGLSARIVPNPDYADGLSTSLKAGIKTLGPGVNGAVICLGDMPALTPEHINRLIAAFDPAEGRAICVPTLRGKRGNPVLWGAQFFAAMTGLSGDAGAKHLIGENEDFVCEVSMDELGIDDAIFTDIDTPAALARFRKDGDPSPR